MYIHSFNADMKWNYLTLRIPPWRIGDIAEPIIGEDTCEKLCNTQHHFGGDSTAIADNTTGYLVERL